MHDRGSENGWLWISMPYVEGQDAEAAAIGYSHGMPAKLELHIVGQVGSALDYAHRHHLLHRDVKPANILLTDAPDVDDPEWAFLTDFGIAKATDEVAALTATGAVIATFTYAARNRSRAAPRSPLRHLQPRLRPVPAPHRVRPVSG